MIEQEIEISTPDGVIDGLLLRPQNSGSWPGVIQFTDAIGPRQATHEQAQRLAAQGYTVLVPNAFYRTGKPPLFTFKPSFPDERSMRRLAELAGPLIPDAIARDAEMYVDFLSAQPWVNSGPIGVVGYCFTGSVALRVAATCPSQIAAVASFHGGGLCTEAPTSPHLLLPRIDTNTRLYFGHADNDRTMPQAAIDKLDEALRAWGGSFESVVYEGARHGWTLADSGVYDKEAAERAFRALTGLFAKTLQR